MRNVDNQKSKSTQVIDDDSKNSDIGLKTWNSLPILDKNHSIIAIKDLNATSPIIQESNSCSSNSNKNNQSRTVELADIINVNYSDLKQLVNSNVDKLMVKPRTPIRKTKNRMKTRHNQNKMFENPFSNIDGKIKDTVEETRSIAITVSTETRSAAIQQLSSNKIGNIPMGSAPEFLNSSWSLEIEGQKDIRTPRKSFMEDGGSSVQPMATGYFPRPVEGQSLTSFLSSAQFSRAHDAELDRENAHFSICEAMIAAIEQVKYNRLQRLDETVDDESDEEINRLKQRIRLRRRQRQEEKCRSRGWTRDLLSDGRTDTTTTTDQSISPLSTSSESISDNVSTEDFEDSEQENERRCNDLFASTIISHTDAESHQAKLATESTPSESSVSAEGVALSLISRFSEKQLPRASELEWLVSEKDAPQRLLPMPKSWPVSPDEVESEDTRTIPLRGTVEWAPPRPQIIFTPHPPPV